MPGIAIVAEAEFLSASTLSLPQVRQISETVWRPPLESMDEKTMPAKVSLWNRLCAPAAPACLMYADHWLWPDCYAMVAPLLHHALLDVVRSKRLHGDLRCCAVSKNWHSCVPMRLNAVDL